MSKNAREPALTSVTLVKNSLNVKPPLAMTQTTARFASHNWYTLALTDGDDQWTYVLHDDASIIENTTINQL